MTLIADLLLHRMVVPLGGQSRRVISEPWRRITQPPSHHRRYRKGDLMSLDEVDGSQTDSVTKVEQEKTVDIEFDLSSRKLKISTRNISWLVVVTTLAGYYCSTL